MMEKNGAVYVGIPLEYHLDALATTPAPTNDDIIPMQTTQTSSSSSSHGLLAFFVGAILASFGWVANQGWTIVSLLLFGQFTWTLESAWKHILLCIFGALCTAIAFWAVFKIIFPNVLDDDDDEEDGSNKALSYKRDVSNALQDLGVLGFVVGNRKFSLLLIVHRNVHKLHSLLPLRSSFPSVSHEARVQAPRCNWHLLRRYKQCCS